MKNKNRQHQIYGESFDRYMQYTVGIGSNGSVGISDPDTGNFSVNDLRQAFEDGANWADEHSNSPWVSPEVDLPELNIPVLVCVHIEYRSMTTIPKPYIVEINNRVSDTLSKRMRRELGEPYTDKYGFPNHGAIVYRILFWAPIPEIPKGGEK